MRTAGLKRGVVIVENPQTGEILAMVSLPTYDNNAFARGISTRRTQAPASNPNKPLLNHAIKEQYPPGLDVQARDRHRRPRRQARSGRRAGPDEAVPAHRHDEVLGLEPPRLRAAQRSRGLRPLERHVLLPGRRHAGDRPARATGPEYGFGAPTGIDLPGEASGNVPDQRLEAGHVRRADLPRRGPPGGHRAGL